MNKRIAGPAYLTTSAANIYSPPNSAVYVIIRHVHFANVTASAAKVTLYIGATGGSAGGTELFKGFSIPPNDTYDWPCELFMASTDFLTGLSDTGTAITITVSGEYRAA